MCCLAELGVLEAADLSGEAALCAGCGVLVHRALAYGLVDALDRKTELCVDVFFSSLGSFENRAGAGTEFCPGFTVAGVALFGLAVALDLALDVCHGGFDLVLKSPSFGPAGNRSRMSGGRNSWRAERQQGIRHMWTGSTDKRQYRLFTHGPVVNPQHIDHCPY